MVAISGCELFDGEEIVVIVVEEAVSKSKVEQARTPEYGYIRCQVLRKHHLTDAKC